VGKDAAKRKVGGSFLLIFNEIVPESKLPRAQVTGVEIPVGKEKLAWNKVPEFSLIDSTLPVRGFLSSI
jgi:hypothetical protein